MSLLHSFYCWGHLGVVLISTAFFALAGIENWRVLAILWAIVPLANMIVFCLVPIYTPQDIDAPAIRPPQNCLGMKVFWLLMLLMICAGASELAMRQWASAFAESALGVSKTVGDLVGPCTFALFMGLARGIFCQDGRPAAAERLYDLLLHPVHRQLPARRDRYSGSRDAGMRAVRVLGRGYSGRAAFRQPRGYCPAAGQPCMRCWPLPVISDAVPGRRWSVRSQAHSGKTCARR